MILSLTSLVVLVALLIVGGYLHRSVLVAAWALSFLLFPTAQAMFGQAPLYIYDLTAVLLLGSVVLRGDLRGWPAGIPRWHLWFIGAAFVLSVVMGTIRHGFVPAMLWIWGHSSVAWMAFAFGVVIVLARHSPGYLAGLRWGIMVSAAALAGISIVQYADLPGSEQIAAFFYGDLGRVESVEILRHGIETNRANGPHNAPPGLAGMALLSILAFWLATGEQQRVARWMVLAASVTTILCTVSRHAMLAAILGLGVIIVLSEARRRARLIFTCAALVLVIGSTVAGFVLKESWAHRLSKTGDGVLSDDNIAARVLWGPMRLAEFVAREPSVLVTGAGLDPDKLAARQGRDMEFETGFVSNGFLLPLYYMGIVGFVLHLIFWLWTLRTSWSFPSHARGIVVGFVVIAIIIVASDNYGFVYEPAIALLMLIAGLVEARRREWFIVAQETEEAAEEAGATEGHPAETGESYAA